jgi:hypothetical protein
MFIFLSLFFLTGSGAAEPLKLVVYSPENGKTYQSDFVVKVGHWPNPPGVTDPSFVEYQFEWWHPSWPGSSEPGKWEPGHWKLDSRAPTQDALGGLRVTVGNFSPAGNWRVRARFADSGDIPWSNWTEFPIQYPAWSRQAPTIVVPAADQRFSGDSVTISVQDPGDLPPGTVAILEWQYSYYSPWKQPSHTPWPKMIPPYTKTIPITEFNPGFWKVRAQFETNWKSKGAFSEWRPFVVEGNIVPQIITPQPGQLFSGAAHVKLAANPKLPDLVVNLDVEYYDNGAWVAKVMPALDGKTRLMLEGGITVDRALLLPHNRWRIRARYDMVGDNTHGPWSDWVEFKLGLFSPMKPLIVKTQ